MWKSKAVVGVQGLGSAFRVQGFGLMRCSGTSKDLLSGSALWIRLDIKDLAVPKVLSNLESMIS